MPVNGSLTQEDIDLLTELLVVEKDRGGFYLAYYDMVKDINPQTANQILMQAHIATYSGFFGGAAILGNALAKYSNPDVTDVYTNSYTLDDFSQDVAEATLALIELEFDQGGDGVVTANAIQVSDQSVWVGNGLGNYFPGNFQLWDEDLDYLLGAGTLFTVIAGFQLVFGSELGFEAAD